MNLFEYQQLAARTIPVTLTGDELYLNAVLGVNGEAGEMADMHKKAMFQGHAYTIEQKVNEIGDVIWYLAAACTALGVSLETVAEQNIAKLRRRYPDGFDAERSVFRDLHEDADIGPASQKEVANEHYIYPQGQERIIVADGGHDSVTYTSTAVDTTNPPLGLNDWEWWNEQPVYTLRDYQEGSGIE